MSPRGAGYTVRILGLSEQCLCLLTAELPSLRAVKQYQLLCGSRLLTAIVKKKKKQDNNIRLSNAFTFLAWSQRNLRMENVESFQLSTKRKKMKEKDI